jgi:hypothetical protein
MPASARKAPGLLSREEPGAVDGCQDQLYGWQPVAQSASA